MRAKVQSVKDLNFPLEKELNRRRIYMTWLLATMTLFDLI